MLVPDSFFVIGNWKMKPATIAEAVSIGKNLTTGSKKGAEVIVCPPALFYHDVKESLSVKVSLGLQNIHTDPEASSYTGGLSAGQAASVGAHYCIVGHSSRRSVGETDQQVNTKIRNCIAEDIIPIVCIGEKQRDNSGGYITELQDQIKASFDGLEKKDFEHIIIAYEPLWAIGSKAQRVATTAEIEEIRIFIDKTINDMTGNIPVGKITSVYGGSVSSTEELQAIATTGMQGVLVGRASLEPEIFNALVESAYTL